ncbi:MAG: hypothetical protein J0I06_12685 [Planctomycetes bacterium]|nr:hypothetical protein [Planctomycetota bacterium]
MRTPALILAVAMAVLLTGRASSQDKANPPLKERTEESVKKVKELQKERIATLRKASEVSLKLAQAARLEVWDAVEDRMSLLNAELEVAEKGSDRITLYTKAVDDLKAYEELAKARFEAGRGTELAVHKAKAKRLGVEIQLERAKIREAKEGK